LNRSSKVITAASRFVVPSQAEVRKVSALAKDLLAKTGKAAKRFPETRGAILGGSYAKGTWLPHHVDLDIFVKIDPSVPEEDFERIGLEIGSRATNGYPTGKKFAQHPYTEAIVGDVRVNIVPCYDVKMGEWKSAADRSPFHVKLVEDIPQEQKTQIRLLKTFMNAIGVYGAEIQRQGFSGYVAEVLIMKLGGLQQTLDWFADFRPASESSHFSLPDPVDQGRDLGVAVSGESLGRMVLASREFLRRPTRAFFHKMAGRARPTISKRVVAVVFSHKPLSEDTLWGELRKTSKHVVRHLQVLGFEVARSMAASDNRGRSAILLVPEFDRLSGVEQRVGPTIDRKKDVEAFLASNKKDSLLIWVDDDARVRLLRPRRYIRITDLLSDIVKGKAGHIGASKELEAGMKKSAYVLSGESLARAASSAQWLRDGIREITSDAIGAR
jgi:tRNA nucleotidyltransferase (CCA-adding enzyme)